MSEPSKEEKNLQNYKVVLMGDTAVGKTSIVDRYTKNKFDSINYHQLELDSLLKY